MGSVAVVPAQVLDIGQSASKAGFSPPAIFTLSCSATQVGSAQSVTRFYVVDADSRRPLQSLTITGTGTKQMSLQGLANPLTVYAEVIQGKALCSAARLTGDAEMDITLELGDFTPNFFPASAAGRAPFADGIITNAKIADATIDLAAKVTGVLPAANIGPGAATLAKLDTTGVLGQTLGVGAAGVPLWIDQPARVPSRLLLRWVPGQKGKPGLAADITNASEAVSALADTSFMIEGLNAVSADCTFAAEGGIQIASHGADGDQTIMSPHSLANLSPWKLTNWGTEDQVIFEELIKTGPNITSAISWLGMKKTNTDVVATDDDQVYFRYKDTENGGKWQCVSSIGGVDTVTDSGVANVLSTQFRFKITVAADRTVTFWINDVAIFTTAALTNGVELFPFLGTGASGAAAIKSLVTLGKSLSRVPS